MSVRIIPGVDIPPPGVVPLTIDNKALAIASDYPEH
jgi:hypothetical protein